MKLMGRCQ